MASIPVRMNCSPVSLERVPVILNRFQVLHKHIQVGHKRAADVHNSVYEADDRRPERRNRLYLRSYASNRPCRCKCGQNAKRATGAGEILQYPRP